MSVIKVHVAGSKSYEGTVFAIDPITRSIILKNEESYRLINSAHITRIEGDLSTTTLPDLSEFGTSVHALEKKEIACHESAEKSIAALNFNVSPEIQALYDRLSFIFPCRWDGESTIIVLDVFRIESPYEKVTQIKGSGAADDAGIQRVVTVLEGERRKLKL